jgi:hypothetical protein
MKRRSVLEQQVGGGADFRAAAVGDQGVEAVVPQLGHTVVLRRRLAAGA